ncbi:hypothetical protein BH11PSE8_BH11PSE8_09040 [soil metagenome]
MGDLPKLGVEEFENLVEGFAASSACAFYEQCDFAHTVPYP